MEEATVNTWDSCCLKMDHRAVQYFSTLSVCSSVITFCIYQLIHSESCERDTLYSSLLTLVLGLIIPNPKIQ